MTDSRLSELIQAIDQAESPAQLVGAVRALAAERSQAGIDTLIRALGFNNPGAALAAVEGLVNLGQVAVSPLLEQLDGYNYGARAYAIRALAAIADPQALDVLLQAAAADFAPSVRRAAAKGLGNLRWHQLAPGQQGSAQTQAFQTLVQVSQDPEWAIRYAAVVGLSLLAQTAHPNLIQPIREQLTHLAEGDGDLAVRARSHLALDRLPPLSAAAPQWIAHSHPSIVPLSL